jgi:hypothetical protein
MNSEHANFPHAPLYRRCVSVSMAKREIVDCVLGPRVWSVRKECRMVDVAGVRGLGDPTVEWKIRSLQPFDDPKRRLDLLVPLLHDLVAWDLVQRDVDGNFVLRQDVQDRLSALTVDRPLRSAEVFVGRKCQVCGLVRLTRMVDGVRTCSPCATPAIVESDADADAGRPKGQWGFFHRHRKAS